MPQNNYDFKKEKVKYFLNSAPYLSSRGVQSLIGERSDNRKISLKIMRDLVQEKPSEFVFIPYWKGHHSSMIIRREALIEREDILNHFVEVLKNRCYGGTL